MAATIGSALHWWSRAESDRSAIIVDDESVTYRELAGWTSRIARSLVDQGVAPGDRVGLLPRTADGYRDQRARTPRRRHRDGVGVGRGCR